MGSETNNLVFDHESQFYCQGSETNNLDYTVCDHESDSCVRGTPAWPACKERELTIFSQQEIVASILH